MLLSSGHASLSGRSISRLPASVPPVQLEFSAEQESGGRAWPPLSPLDGRLSPALHSDPLFPSVVVPSLRF